MRQKNKKLPLSSLPSAAPCKIGDELTPEQLRQLFPGMQAFVQHLYELSQKAEQPPDDSEQHRE